MNRLRFSIFVTGIVTSLSAHGHPGGLDANGGHFNRKTGEYHTHRASAAAPTPAPFAPRRTPPAPRLSPRMTAPREGAWAEASESKKFRNSFAAQELREAKSDPRASAERSDKHADSKLHFAQKFVDDAKFDAARKLLNEILADYPMSKAATEAKELLRVLP